MTLNSIDFYNILLEWAKSINPEINWDCMTITEIEYGLKDCISTSGILQLADLFGAINNQLRRK
jgi:hypothetical protein